MHLFDEIPYLEDSYIVLKQLGEKDANALEKMSDNPEVTWKSQEMCSRLIPKI